MIEIDRTGNVCTHSYEHISMLFARGERLRASFRLDQESKVRFAWGWLSNGQDKVVICHLSGANFVP